MPRKKKEKTRFTDKELGVFKNLIEKRLEKARSELNYYLDQLKEAASSADAKIKGLDDGNMTVENERVSNLAARQKKLIQHLENALIRIENKAYGICRETGKLISKDRLKAVPHATLSIEAKQKR